jgi:hypothetical protein
MPFGEAGPGVVETIAIANFDTIPTQVSVNVILDGNAALAPESVEIAARSVTRVIVGDRAPVGTGYQVDVRVLRQAPVAVEAFTAWTGVTGVPGPSASSSGAPTAGGPTATAAVATGTVGSVSGVATLPGQVTVSKRWAFATTRPESGDAVFSAVNTSTEPVTVQLFAYVAGDPNSPKSAPAVALGPGERTYFSCVELGIPAGRVVVIVGDKPIVASRTYLIPTPAPAAPGVVPGASTPSTSVVAGISVSAGVPA